MQAQGFHYYSDVIYLSNGNLIVENCDGDEGYYIEYVEYTLDGYSFSEINSVYFEDCLDFYDDGYEEIVSISINGEDVSETEYYNMINEYTTLISTVLAKDSSPMASTDWTSAVNSAPNCSMSFDEAWELIAPSPSEDISPTETSPNNESDLALTQEQAMQAFENYWAEYSAPIIEEYGDEEVFGWYNTFEYSNNDSNDTTCVYVHEFYEGANCYYYTYYYMDLFTGSVQTVEYEELGPAVEGGPCTNYINTTYDVFNGLDYIY